MRLTSEVVETKFSSSMASVCLGSLALIDAGVRLSEPACGVAFLFMILKKKRGDKMMKNLRCLTCGESQAHCLYHGLG